MMSKEGQLAMRSKNNDNKSWARKQGQLGMMSKKAKTTSKEAKTTSKEAKQRQLAMVHLVRQQ